MTNAIFTGEDLGTNMIYLNIEYVKRTNLENFTFSKFKEQTKGSVPTLIKLSN